MCESILECSKQLSERDSNVRALIISGYDGAFSSGKDLKASLQHTDTEAAQYYDKTISSVKELLRVPIPIVVSMERICLGLGLELALTGDIRVCGKSTQFGFPEINLSLFPGCGGAVMLPAILGNTSIANDWIFTGRRVFADEAKSVGLVSRVVDDGEAFNESLKIARDLIRKNRPLLVKTKSVVKHNFNRLVMDSDWMRMSEECRQEVAKHPDHLAALALFSKPKK